MITIITPTYNNPKQLELFLKSVANLDYPRTDMEVIVVDDGSKMDIKDVVNKFKFAKFIKMQQHSGPSVSRNKGAQISKGDYLIFFDSDVTLKPNIINLFVESFKKGELAVTGEYDPEPLNDSFFPRFKSIINESWKPDGKYISVFVLRAGGIKRDVFQKVGGFNENIKGASVEDYEFADRLKREGIKILFNADILVRHHHPSYIKQIKVFYQRARDWADVFIDRKGRLDNYCANPQEGLGNIFGFSFLVFAVFYFFTKSLILQILSMISLVIFIFFNFKFINIAHRRNGIAFIPLAILIKCSLSIPIVIGFGVGIINKIFKGIQK